MFPCGKPRKKQRSHNATCSGNNTNNSSSRSNGGRKKTTISSCSKKKPLSETLELHLKAQVSRVHKQEWQLQYHHQHPFVVPTQIVHQGQSELSGNCRDQGVGHIVQTKVPHAACHRVPVSRGGPSLATTYVIYSLHLHGCGATPQLLT